MTGRPGQWETIHVNQPSTGKATSAGIPSDGTYVVGSDIKPGTYRSERPQGGLVTKAACDQLLLGATLRHLR